MGDTKRAELFEVRDALTEEPSRRSSRARPGLLLLMLALIALAVAVMINGFRLPYVLQHGGSGWAGSRRTTRGSATAKASAESDRAEIARSLSLSEG